VLGWRCIRAVSYAFVFGFITALRRGVWSELYPRNLALALELGIGNCGENSLNAFY
jgi:hypothetical protein